MCYPEAPSLLLILASASSRSILELTGTVSIWDRKFLAASHRSCLCDPPTTKDQVMQNQHRGEGRRKGEHLSSWLLWLAWRSLAVMGSAEHLPAHGKRGINSLIYFACVLFLCLLNCLDLKPRVLTSTLPFLSPISLRWGEQVAVWSWVLSCDDIMTTVHESCLDVTTMLKSYLLMMLPFVQVYEYTSIQLTNAWFVRLNSPNFGILSLHFIVSVLRWSWSIIFKSRWSLFF